MGLLYKFVNLIFNHFIGKYCVEKVILCFIFIELIFIYYNDHIFQQKFERFFEKV